MENLIATHSTRYYDAARRHNRARCKNICIALAVMAICCGFLELVNYLLKYQTIENSIYSQKLFAFNTRLVHFP